MSRDCSSANDINNKPPKYCTVNKTRDANPEGAKEFHFNSRTKPGGAIGLPDAPLITGTYFFFFFHLYSYFRISVSFRLSRISELAVTHMYISNSGGTHYYTQKIT